MCRAQVSCSIVRLSPTRPRPSCAAWGVSPQTLAHFNLTSEEVAREMALGALSRSPANVAVSNTGVTDAVDATIPRGTQCYAWAFRLPHASGVRVFTETRRFHGDRHRIRQDSAHHALESIVTHWHTLHMPSRG